MSKNYRKSRKSRKINKNIRRKQRVRRKSYKKRGGAAVLPSLPAHLDPTYLEEVEKYKTQIYANSRNIKSAEAEVLWNDISNLIKLDLPKYIKKIEDLDKQEQIQYYNLKRNAYSLINNLGQQMLPYLQSKF